jgi:hypothetical protein
VVILVGGKEVEHGSTTLQLPCCEELTQMAAGFDQVDVVKAGYSEIRIQQSTGTVQVITACFVRMLHIIKTLESQPSDGTTLFRSWEQGGQNLLCAPSTLSDGQRLIKQGLRL